MFGHEVLAKNSLLVTVDSNDTFEFREFLILFKQITLLASIIASEIN